MYLGYDIKSIQEYIFSIPRLKCITGGSALVAEFDDLAKQLGRDDCIFSGGGRGAFRCASEEAANGLSEQLRKAARERGLDLRLASGETLPSVVGRADQLFPAWPSPSQPGDCLTDQPCSVSGLLPVSDTDPHPLVRLRIQKAGTDHLTARLLEDLQGRIPDELADYRLQFFRTVTPEPGEGEDESQANREAKAGLAALGKRNRWAVVVMDGNGIGRQFRSYRLLADADEINRRYEAASEALDRCTRGAFCSALAEAITQWVADLGEEDLQDCIVRTAGGQAPARLILPFRPLILGGDDVTLLCHSRYALPFVRHMAAAFRKNSGQEEFGTEPLWMATGGELTISAGILYSKVTFPLHMAVRYAHQLLDNAKRIDGATSDSGKPKPAAVDWDAITDTLVESPEARRNRELRFVDDELNLTVELTRRPYVLEPDGRHPDLDSLQDLQRRLADVPESVRARILPNLRRPWSERVSFLASVAKRHPVLWELLWEGDGEPAAGWYRNEEARVLKTGVPDALLLLGEEHRMSRPSVSSNRSP